MLCAGAFALCTQCVGVIDPWGQFHQRVYEQLLRMQILKGQKALTVFFALLGSALVKAACKMLVKLTPDEIS